MDTLYNYPLDLVNSLKHGVPEKQNSDSAHTESVTCDQSENSVIEEKNEPQSVCNEDSANLTSHTDSQETVSKQDIVSHEKEHSEKQSESSSNVLSGDNQTGSASKWSKKAEKWMKKKYKTPKNRAEAKLNRAKEIEAARNIILQKNVDWLVKLSSFHVLLFI